MDRPNRPQSDPTPDVSCQPGVVTPAETAAGNTGGVNDAPLPVCSSVSVSGIHRRDWTDIGYTAAACVYHHHVSYKVYSIFGTTESGDVLLCLASGPVDDPTPDISIADVYLHGDVRWDGCSNWYFDEQDRVMLHCCSRDDLINFGVVMSRCHDWTKELLPHFRS